MKHHLKRLALMVPGARALIEERDRLRRWVRTLAAERDSLARQNASLRASLGSASPQAQPKESLEGLVRSGDYAVILWDRRNIPGLKSD